MTPRSGSVFIVAAQKTAEIIGATAVVPPLSPPTSYLVITIDDKAAQFKEHKSNRVPNRGEGRTVVIASD